MTCFEWCQRVHVDRTPCARSVLSNEHRPDRPTDQRPCALFTVVRQRQEARGEERAAFVPASRRLVSGWGARGGLLWVCVVDWSATPRPVIRETDEAKRAQQRRHDTPHQHTTPAAIVGENASRHV